MSKKIAGIIFSFLFILICCFGCNSSSNSSDGENNAQRLPSKADFLQKKLPQLHQTLEKKSALKQLVNDYAYTVLNANHLVTSEQILKDIFVQREEELMPELHEFFQNLSGQNPDLFNSQEGEKLLNELKSIGMSGIFAEGMYVFLGTAPVLEPQLKSLASEPFRLYIEFNNAETEAWQGEYPYLDLTGEKKMVYIGEQLLFNHQETEYAPKIREYFYIALTVLTDIRALTGQTENTFLTGGGLSTDFYPFATDLEQIKSYATEYPNSRYTKIIQNITRNFSDILANGEIPQPVYMVWVQDVKVDKNNAQNNETLGCRTTAEQIKNVFLNKGLDIPHVVNVYQNNEEVCGIVYRFHADKSKAEQALKTLQNIAPDIKPSLKKAVINVQENRWDLE
ncbi:MAG: hypothetical protein IPM47_10425 [Sphingobacteriales bacterium]|nr:MAG: hypothetical protein IPM47_10425 [Sphingobacteriales bacterium]